MPLMKTCVCAGLFAFAFSSPVTASAMGSKYKPEEKNLISNQGKPKKSVFQHIGQQNTRINEIFAKGKTPTGRPGYLRGDQPWVYFYSKSPLNASDVKYGSFLKQVYDLYCDSKGHNNQCLDGGLKIDFKATGKSKSNPNLYVKLNGKSKVSNSFQEIRSFVFEQLEDYGGKAPISLGDRNKIQPAPKTIVKTRFLIHTKNDGSGNGQWVDNNSLRYPMLRQAEDALGNIFMIRQYGSKLIKDNNMYGKKQKDLLNHYAARGDSTAIVAAVSSPNANDAGGMAWINRPGRPFVMKSCRAMHKKNYSLAEDARCTARGIYLHEMAHVFGLNHCKSPNQSSLCTENFWKRSDGRQWLLKNISDRMNAVEISYDY